MLINPKTLFQPRGSYSQAVLTDTNNKSLLFITGQVALDGNGKIVGLNDITVQTECIFQNIVTILKKAGGNLKDIVKVQTFITDMRLYPVFSKIRDRYLKDSKPASTLFEVSQLFKKGLLIEMEAIATVPNKK
ncbi:hypothetical protein COV87_01730 [Candidatus Roizmanbacteria bacterium CG11_big_fil_rev_8_21_14_0_20_37_16]|uniref:Enamine deaminase RidA n=1 Tax=Candidatus Roizmanbacteria bacterium CG11_big_fil_rev_8_21_14_0_20_37_16 TaxID=1974857 RepID=A0A2H0KKD9_9BACT|nr:MAG: hypothetical protein COV87_01730 [Candidatus Roizmanbacteria bacterium CG11_big_fil_rev_8_21_14_0_20_37_16]